MAARFKRDENITLDAETLLGETGHEVQTVFQERLGGRTGDLLDARHQFDRRRRRPDPLLAAVAGKGLLGNLDHAEASELLHVARHRGAVAPQAARQIGDRAGLLPQRSEQLHALWRAQRQQIVGLLERDHPALGNPLARVGAPRELAALLPGGRTAVPKGVYRYRTLDEADRQLQRWIAQAMADARAAPRG